jgi:8-oxo-dGTP pyrophosphatase MutT (NUDIX family)
MSRAIVGKIFEQVTLIDPIDAREATSKTLLLEGLGMPRPFSEQADPTHVTASAIVVGPAGVLLHFHKKLRLWLQPGGHIEEGEAPWDAAQREVLEETGLRPELPDVASAPRWHRPEAVFHVDVHPAGTHTHLDLRYLLFASGTPAPPPGESQLVRWFSWDEALAAADAGLIGALRGARARLGLG